MIISRTKILWIGFPKKTKKNLVYKQKIIQEAISNKIYNEKAKLSSKYLTGTSNLSTVNAFQFDRPVLELPDEVLFLIFDAAG